MQKVSCAFSCQSPLHVRLFCALLFDTFSASCTQSFIDFLVHFAQRDLSCDKMCSRFWRNESLKPSEEGKALRMK